MGLRVRRWMEKVHSGLSNGIGSTEASLRLLIARTIEWYGILLRERKQEPAYIVKEFVDAHFRQPGLSYKTVSGHLGLAERSMRNQFKSEFNISIWAYCISLRVQTAHELMKANGLLAGEVFDLVGYSDESSLRYHMRKFRL
ncbi:hypothetical protein LAG90_18590 [Marinilongibacter aquaticus]|uniref:AraC family transcriptional regulator n=1 Tax=Marinilongibacter aquaticus TaxID=2975157 RepID=UPI0021BD535F|nr:AraC family transcriptional regulator [Marinilongibacter aquaticus]UBM58809.1 hypothetical protein LAG90_18590 [Marinilongibacter aquaticus]